MPIKVQNDLPVKEVLENENIFVMDENRAMHQDIRPLQILILNLMPLKEDTELQLLRCLSNSPMQLDITFMIPATHHIKNQKAVSHINKFYVTFDDVRDRFFDGMIVTGAPIEQIPFEEVDYWKELVEIMDWTERHVTSTMYQCWGAQAAIYHFYGIQKRMLPEKMFGLYRHRVHNRKIPLVRGFDDEFYVPHSRHTEEHKEDILKVPELTILAEAEQPAGVYAIANLEKRQFFITGHAEYDPNTLKQEYDRDEKAGLHPQIPVNYYPNDDPTQKPIVRWRSVAHLLFANWLNYYVYQETPYELDAICSDRED